MRDDMVPDRLDSLGVRLDPANLEETIMGVQRCIAFDVISLFVV